MRSADVELNFVENYDDTELPEKEGNLSGFELILKEVLFSALPPLLLIYIIYSQ